MNHYYPLVSYPFTMPFYYSSLTMITVYYLVPVENVNPFLSDTGLLPAQFDGQAMVSYNFQLYTGQFSAGINAPIESWLSSGAAVVQEAELNIIAYPITLEANVLPLTAMQFIQDGDQTKILGNHRVRVPCDSDRAIAAGIALMGEPKFKTSFKVNLPSANPVRQDSIPFIPQWVQSWGFQIDDPDNPNEYIFNVLVDLSGMNAIPGNNSPITEYGTYEDKIIACGWNIPPPFNTYFFSPADVARVNLSYGTSSHPMLLESQALIGTNTPFAVQTFNSAPAAMQNRAFFT